MEYRTDFKCQFNDDIDSQEGSDEDIDEEGVEAFDLLARNFRKFFRKGNRFGRGNRFGNGANRFGRGRANSFGNKGGESSKQKGACCNYEIEGHFTKGTLSFFVLLLGCGLLVLLLSSPVEDKPFELEFMPFLVMTEGCETVIGFVLELALTGLGTFLASLETLSGLILNMPGVITLALFTPLETGCLETELE
nr:hypothetical protein [Tanacetum cinerariifolium]